MIRSIDEGEAEAIHLASELNVSILLDDRDARKVAQARGINMFGTIAILELLARRDQIDLPKAVEALRKTNFFIPKDVVATALERDRQRKK